MTTLQRLTLIALCFARALSADSARPFARQEQDIKAIQEKLYTLQANINHYNTMVEEIAQGKVFLMSSYFSEHKDEVQAHIKTAMDDLYNTVGTAHKTLNNHKLYMTQEYVRALEHCKKALATPDFYQSVTNIFATASALSVIENYYTYNRNTYSDEIVTCVQKTRPALIKVRQPGGKKFVLYQLQVIIELDKKSQAIGKK